MEERNSNKWVKPYIKRWKPVRNATENVVSPPLHRSQFTLISHPLKDELIFFGGDYWECRFISCETDDLFFYNINSKTWTEVRTPSGPEPRAMHQMVASPARGGQLWLFGGSADLSDNISGFVYETRWLNDLWVFHLHNRCWEQIISPNSPSGRIHHSMICRENQLFIVGGETTISQYPNFKEVYIFCTDTYIWHKVEPTGDIPTPRTGTLFSLLNNGVLLLHGGYEIDIFSGMLKDEVQDAYCLTPHRTDNSGLKWKWSQINIGVPHQTTRDVLVVIPNNIEISDIENGKKDLMESFLDGAYSIDLQKLFGWSMPFKRIIEADVNLDKMYERFISFETARGKDSKLSGRNEIKEGAQEEGNHDHERGTINEIPNLIDMSDHRGLYKLSLDFIHSKSTATNSSLNTVNVLVGSSQLPIKNGIVYMYKRMFDHSRYRSESDSENSDDECDLHYLPSNFMEYQF